MATTVVEGTARSAVPAAVGSALRAAFGVVWTIDAYLTWRPEFAAHYVGYLQNAAHGQPPWLQPWFAFWLGLVTPHPAPFIWATRAVETLIAVGLLLGLARKWVYVAGALFSLLLWGTAEGFGGPYAVGTANLGPALVYVLLFVALIVINRHQGATPYSVDYYLERRWPRWRRASEWAPRAVLARLPVALPWTEQVTALLGIALALLFLFGTLASALGAAPPTPRNAAAAVAPLSVASSGPVPEARDARLPPLLGTGADVAVGVRGQDQIPTLQHRAEEGLGRRPRRAAARRAAPAGSGARRGCRPAASRPASPPRGHGRYAAGSRGW
ncbi:MAG TPA: DoxX family protein [Thermomicrobiales bacterium]|nr:DoxX family protein [Thermomicrobiales bacterium]